MKIKELSAGELRAITTRSDIRKISHEAIGTTSRESTGARPKIVLRPYGLRAAATRRRHLRLYS